MFAKTITTRLGRLAHRALTVLLCMMLVGPSFAHHAKPHLSSHTQTQQLTSWMTDHPRRASDSKVGHAHHDHAGADPSGHVGPASVATGHDATTIAAGQAAASFTEARGQDLYHTACGPGHALCCAPALIAHDVSAGHPQCAARFVRAANAMFAGGTSAGLDRPPRHLL